MKIISSEKPQMGWVCSYTPLELIYAAGFLPYRIVGHSNPVIDADAYIHTNFCQFVRSTVDNAIEGKYDFLEGVVFVNSCDAMRRLHDLWKNYIPSKFIYILDIPMGYSLLGSDYIREEFEKLKVALENYNSKTIQDKAIEESIDIYMESRSLFHRLNSLRLENPPLIKASEIISVISHYFESDPKVWNKDVKKMLLEGWEASCSPQNIKPRVILSGSPIHDSNFISFIEECNLDVVYEDLCSGSKFFDVKVNKGKDLIKSLSEAYLNRVPCARMMKIEERAKNLMTISKQSKVNGIIHHSLKFCDTYLYDVPKLKELLMENGLNVLFIESDGTLGSINQLKTRIEAFSEMLKRGM
ncbi:MAG: 2-hydroxyacyl-CoA dehydratase subunit D [Candidatus Heimdallarchaeota archaeon]